MTINIEVVYALPDEQTLLKKEVPEGTTVLEGIQASGLLEKFPALDVSAHKLGIFGKLTKQDRIEIYRPLIADPKEVRRRRAEEGKVMKKGGGDA
jgi:putative ubiquitin-RnfH superfamily antitoxin RatB of RatAB toxin-antitoxin module